MKIFSSTENWVKCGRCSSEFDVSKNPSGCPMCGFGRNDVTNITPNSKVSSYLLAPPEMKLKKGTVLIDDSTKLIGSWGMFNDFFSGKAVCRILGHMQSDTKSESIKLSDLIEKTKEMVVKNNLSELKGFPNDVSSDSSIGRLVYHFISTFADMGLVDLRTARKATKNIWDENWNDIMISLTNEGHEFSKLPNRVFDENDHSAQILTPEEKKWLLQYLQEIDKKGYKEYTILSQVYSFIRKGNNGKDDLREWFKKNDNFVRSVKLWSRKKSEPKAFQKQIDNLASTFASSKLSLLREFGVIRDRRNDYTVIGDF